MVVGAAWQHGVSESNFAICSTLRQALAVRMAIYVWEKEVLEVLPGFGKPKYEPTEAVKFHTRITSKYYDDDYAVG